MLWIVVISYQYKLLCSCWCQQKLLTEHGRKVQTPSVDVVQLTSRNEVCRHGAMHTSERGADSHGVCFARRGARRESPDARATRWGQGLHVALCPIQPFSC